MTSRAPKIALVTGGAQRVGKAIVRDLAANGWAVAVHFNRSHQAAEDLVAEIRSAGGQAVALGADLGDEAAVSRLVPEAAAALGPPTLLVNNASVFEYDTILQHSRESWDRHMEANLRAPVVLIRAFAESLPADRAGNVINLLDQRVWNPTPHFMSYTVSRAGLWTLTQTLAMALAPRIRVNAIGPGPTLKAERQTEEQFARQWQSIPLKRSTDPAEIAAAIRFLVDAPAVTGQMIALDGGEHLGYAQPTRGIVAFE